MESSYLGKAFKAFDELNEELFDVTDDGIHALDKFYDGDNTDVIAVIDADAEEEEDLKDSYVGKVILECPVCNSMIYKDTDDIHVEEDASELVNVEEECPCCHTVGGFHIIGTVAPYGEEKKEEEEEVEVEDKTEEITEASDPRRRKVKTLEKRIKEETKSIDTGIAVEGMLAIRDGSVSDAMEDYYQADEAVNEFVPDVDFWETIDPQKYDIGASWAILAYTKDKKVYLLLGELNGLWDFDIGDVEWFDRKDIEYRPGYQPDDNNGIDESEEEIPADDIIFEDAGDDSKGSTYDEVLKFLDEMDYDVEDEGVKAYAEEAAEYIDFARAQKDGHYSVRQWYKETQANFPEDLKGLKRIVTEGLEKVCVTTDKEHIELHADEDGKVTVSTEPKEEEVEKEEEVIVPVDDEVVDKIEASEEEEDEEIPEDEDVDIDITDFDEEKFDELAEKFLTRTYDNVAGYKTTSGGIDDDKIVLEGVIRYKSGKEVPTKYIFESVDLDENNRLHFVGSNKGLTAHKKPFTMRGFVEGKKLIAESLDYDFESKCAETGKRTHCKGSI